MKQSDSFKGIDWFFQSMEFFGRSMMNLGEKGNGFGDLILSMVDLVNQFDNFLIWSNFACLFVFIPFLLPLFYCLLHLI